MRRILVYCNTGMQKKIDLTRWACIEYSIVGINIHSCCIHIRTRGGIYGQICPLAWISSRGQNALSCTAYGLIFPSNCRAQSCTATNCTALNCTSLHCPLMNCTALHWTALNCTALQCTQLKCTVLHITALNPVYWIRCCRGCSINSFLIH